MATPDLGWMAHDLARKGILAFGIGAVLFSAALGFHMYHTYGPGFPDGPLRKPIAEADPGEYVVLENFTLDCTTTRRFDRWGPITVGRQGATGFLLEHASFRCEDRPPWVRVSVKGFSSWHRAQLARSDLLAGGVRDEAYLSDKYGPENIKAAWFSIVPALVGLWIAISAGRKKRWDEGMRRYQAKVDAERAKRVRG